MNVPDIGRWIGCTTMALSLFVAGCDSRASRTQKALDEYQTASVSGDLQATRKALVALTAADEDNPTYWVELGKLQYQLHDYTQAYNAFTRANELNRSDPDVLRYLTQISLMSGDLETAERHTKELDLLVPGDPMALLTAGLIALRRGNFDDAKAQADRILAKTPLDGNALVLKSRALFGLKDRDASLKLLQDQITRNPQDGITLRALINFHRLEGDWKPIVSLGQRYRAIQPDDHPVELATIEAALRTGDPAAARAMSLAVLKPSTPVDQVRDVLNVWTDYWKGPEGIALARQLGASAGPPQRVAYARFLNESGQPDAAIQLVGQGAAHDSAPDDLDARAAYLGAIGRKGRREEARAGLEDVLARDSDNDTALSALAPLLVEMGDKPRALNMAQKLVTIDPADIDSRLILARTFAAAGDRAGAERSLWNAFHDIPASERIYTSLRTYLGQGTDEARRLDQEFTDQQQRKIMQDSI